VSRGPGIAALALVALLLLALLGPMLAGPDGAPTLAPSASQLLPPGTRVVEVRLEDGGWVRARAVEWTSGVLRVATPGGWRSFSGLAPAGAPRTRRSWLGTDHQGRDILARLAVGARTSLLVGGLGCLLALALGTLAGVMAALAGAGGQALLALATDTALGLPRLLLLLMLGISLRGSSVGVAAAIGLASWMEVARLSAAETRTLRASRFVEGARASGAGVTAIVLRHLLPGLAPVLAAAAPLVLTEAIILESTLAFLGVSGSLPSWGRMIADGQRLGPDAWWLVVFPGTLLLTAALAVHGASARARPPRSSFR